MLIAVTSDFWINTEHVQAMRVYSDSDSPNVRIVFYLDSGHEVSSPPLSPDVAKEIVEGLISVCGVTRLTDALGHKKAKRLKRVL